MADANITGNNAQDLTDDELGELANFGPSITDEQMEKLERSAADRVGGKRGCKLPQSAKVALDALKLAQEQHGTPPPATVRDRWGMQAPGVVVTEEQWRDVAYKSGISGSDAPDAKRMAFNRAFQMLQQKEQIRVWDGFVWALW